MSKKLRVIVCALIVILAVVALVATVNMHNKFDVIKDYAQLKGEACALYEEGKYDEAIMKLESYCMYVVTDIDAMALLGDWYLETEQSEKAYKQYYSACESKKTTEEKLPSLTVKNKSEIIMNSFADFVMEITPDVRCTKDMTLNVKSANIAPAERVGGKIVLGEKELEENENFYTTGWFDVDPDGQYLTMSGGFNCAIWQFLDKNGSICAQLESENQYRVADTTAVDVYQMARVVLVEDAVKCRVTYFDVTKADTTASPYEELSIVYGRLPGTNCNSDCTTYEIPDLKEGEKIVYDADGWHMETKDGSWDLTDWKMPKIERGSSITIGGTLPGRVSFEKTTEPDYNKDGIYTIRFDSDSPAAMGQRADDAKNLGFNAAVGNALITVGENDFDRIYPWKDMKLCSIKDGEITYYGESSLPADDAGDVFVEIPKFYVRRVVDNKYDTISIAGVMHEGFEVDPAFVTKDGEVDKIYVAAYLSAEDADGNIVSGASTMPLINISYNEIVQKTKAKGEGYYEMDYAALSALQKLFMVETGLRNSQYLYMGICAYISQDEYSCAVLSGENTNRIVIDGKNNFEKGNNIVVLDSSDSENADVRKVKNVRNNSDGTTSVFFDGDAIDVKKGKTAIIHIATNNGSTVNVAAATGAVATQRGTVGFKYRNIENLWGNCYVYIGNTRVENNAIVICDRGGNEKTINYKLPDTQNLDDEHSVIRRLGYDQNNPTVMLPCEVNSLTTVSTFYGDSCKSGGDGEYVLRHGGSWSSAAAAGLFACDATVKADEKAMDTAGRMMYIK